MRSVFYSIAGCLTGVILGGLLKLYLHEDPPPGSVGVINEKETLVLPFEEPRPTLANLCEATDTEASGMLSHYLRDATFDEVIALAEEMRQGNTEIEHLIWVVQTRGLELDAQGMLAWTRRKNSPSLLASLYSLWAVMDPRAALEAGSEGGYLERSTVLSAIEKGDWRQGIEVVREVAPGSTTMANLEGLRFTELAEVDIHAALSEALSEGDSVLGKVAMKAVIDVWVRKDAVAALEWIQKQDDLPGSSDLMGIAIKALAGTLPHVALEKVEAMPISKQRTKFEGDVVRVWAAKDRSAALEWVKSLEPGLRRDSLVISTFQDLQKDPKELAALVMGMDIDLSRSLEASETEIFNGAGSEKVGHESDAYFFIESIGLGAVELAKESPESGLSVLYQVNALRSKEAAKIIKDWTSDAPETAANWASELPSGKTADLMLQRVYTTWGENDPEEAARSLNEQELVDKPFVDRFTQQWAEKDPVAALEWIEGLDDERRAHLFEETISTVARVDPVLSLQHLDQLTNPEAQDELMKTATAAWRETDPQGVMTWFQNQPPEALVDDLVMQTSRDWVLNSPLEASEWIDKMEVSPRRNQAIAGMVEALILSTNPDRDFEAAEAWAQRITNVELRDRWVAEVEGASDGK